MKINSVWHLTLSGRSLRIDSVGVDVSSRNAVVFTKPVKLNGYIKENTRIVPENIAKKMKLRKYISLSKNTSVIAGAFEINIEDFSKETVRYNIAINSICYFISFIPETVKPLSKDSILLIPVDSRYYSVDDLPELVNLIDISGTDKVFVSGDMTNDFSKICRKKIIITNEFVQQQIF